MIELVDRLEAQDERRPAVLLEDDRRGERRLEAVSHAVSYHLSEAAQRRASGRRLVVVRERVEIPLDCGGRLQSPDQSLFNRGEGRARRRITGRQHGSSGRWVA